MSFGMRIIKQYNNTAEQVIATVDVGPVEFFRRQEVDFLVKNEYLSYVGGNLRLMSGLDLSCNNLTGFIPLELGDLMYVHSLNLSHNALFGPIPSKFSNPKEVESLDISYNNLSGTIPSQLVELNFLEIFNVSYNNLTGRVPETGQFANFDETNYLGNPGLHGFQSSQSYDPNNKVLPPASSNNEDEGDDDHSRIDMVYFYGVLDVMCCYVPCNYSSPLHQPPVAKSMV